MNVFLVSKNHQLFSYVVVQVKCIIVSKLTLFLFLLLFFLLPFLLLFLLLFSLLLIPSSLSPSPSFLWCWGSNSRIQTLVLCCILVSTLLVPCYILILSLHCLNFECLEVCVFPNVLLAIYLKHFSLIKNVLSSYTIP